MGDRFDARLRARDDRGLGLVGLVVSLALLGLLAASTAIGLSSLPNQSTVRLAGPSTAGAPALAGPAGGKSPSSFTPIGGSATAACRADAESVDEAQQAYQALSPSGDFAGTSPTAGGIALLVQAHDLRSPPGNATRYTIDTGTDGAVNVINLTTTAAATFEEDPDICDGA